MEKKVCVDWQPQRLQDILTKFEPCDTFNMNEMVLFYKLLRSEELKLLVVGKGK